MWNEEQVKDQLQYCRNRLVEIKGFLEHALHPLTRDMYVKEEERLIGQIQILEKILAPFV